MIRGIRKSRKQIMQAMPKYFAPIILCVLLLAACKPAPAPPTSPTSTSLPATETLAPTLLHEQSMQLANSNAPTSLSPRRSRDLSETRIGVDFEGFERYSESTEHVYGNGFKLVRIQSLTDFWGEGNGLALFLLEEIPPEVDAVISDYLDNGVTIMLDLWIGAGLTPHGNPFQSEAENSQYLDYVSLVVSHFKGRIGYYQIWNEPGALSVSEYANLVSRTVPVIREADPEAKIIIPGMFGNWDNGIPGYGNYQRFSLDLVYLFELLNSGVAPIIDAISFHPFYDNIPSDPYYQDYPLMLQRIKDLASSHGFAGEYFAGELLWRTVTEEGWAGGPPVSKPIAAKYYTRSITMHRGLNTNVTINTFFLEPFLAPIHNLNDTLAGAEPVEIPISVDLEDSNLSQYAFVLPNGDKLIALWINDEAVEEDPGVSTTLTVQDFSANQVIGIDVFQGLEQELDFEMDDSDLLINYLLVRDYPIFIKLIGTAP